MRFRRNSNTIPRDETNFNIPDMSLTIAPMTILNVLFLVRVNIAPAFI